jgi:hypothetical protein
VGGFGPPLINMAVVIPNILTLETIQIVSNNIELLSTDEREEGLQNDDMVSGSWSWYGLHLTDAILMHIQPKVERAVHKTLYPTYSFVRIYYEGHYLHRHTDRNACEISVSLPVKFDKPWAIYMDEIPYTLELGEAAVYNGCKEYHWREPYTGKQSTHVFCHYVDANGPYAHLKNDNRNNLGAMGTKYSDVLMQ